jgi:hypothetical protein
LICFGSPSSCRSSARQPQAIRCSAARVSGRRFCAPLRFPASYMPLMCLFCAPLRFCASPLPLLCTSTLLCYVCAPLRFCASSVPLLCLSKCGCQSGQRTIPLSSVHNTGCIQHWLQCCLQHWLQRFIQHWLYTTLLCILKCMPRSWNIIFIPIQMSYNRNMFLFWYGFCHLQKVSYLHRLLVLLTHLRYLSSVFLVVESAQK